MPKYQMSMQNLGDYANSLGFKKKKTRFLVIEEDSDSAEESVSLSNEGVSPNLVNEGLKSQKPVIGQ